jgi:hypothetical protein
MAFRPSPQAMSRAEPGGIDSTSGGKNTFGPADHTRSLVAYLSSHEVLSIDMTLRCPAWDDSAMDGLWQPLTPEEVKTRFEPFDVDWWVAGGLAIDLFLGWHSRGHEDIDLEMFKIDRDVLFDVFPGWDLFFVEQSKLHAWRPGLPVPQQVFGIWGRPTPHDPWAVEIMLSDGDGETWQFRRDNDISFPRSRLTQTGPDGIRYCVPEVQLLFKAKKHRAKDDADMVQCLHRLDSAQRSWLSNALKRSEPLHPWLALIEQAESGGAE